jgi:hypothetical protein
MNSTDLDRSVLCGKCVAIPLFSPPVGKVVRGAFDLLLKNSDFLAATAPMELYHALAPLVQSAAGAPVILMTLLAYYPVYINKSDDAASAVAAICGQRHARLTSYVRGLVEGNANLSFGTLFGKFEKGNTYVELAQNMMSAPIAELSRYIESLRRQIMVSVPREHMAQRLGQRIAIITTVRQMRFEAGPET